MNIVKKPDLPKTILVVDDDDGVRLLTANILRELGYQVFEAPDGASGLSLIREQGPTIDLLVTDVIMPQMSGIALALAAQTAMPNLRVLFMSGYAHSIATLYGEGDRQVEVLVKPFTVDALASKVAGILDGKPSKRGA